MEEGWAERENEKLKASMRRFEILGYVGSGGGGARGSVADEEQKRITQACTARYNYEKSKAMKDDEEEFNDGAIFVETQSYEWEDMYKPRKPRFFNRVKTGYEWNKYNQTHYDQDNPPPKVVQGYKFNIFYPDLINKQKTPQFYLENSTNQDTVVIRFHAGPPYEVSETFVVGWLIGCVCVFSIRGACRTFRLRS